jgi:hypothetical protein
VFLYGSGAFNDNAGWRHRGCCLLCVENGQAWDIILHALAAYGAVYITMLIHGRVSNMLSLPISPTLLRWAEKINTEKESSKLDVDTTNSSNGFSFRTSSA